MHVFCLQLLMAIKQMEVSRDKGEWASLSAAETREVSAAEVRTNIAQVGFWRKR